MSKEVISLNEEEISRYSLMLSINKHETELCKLGQIDGSEFKTPSQLAKELDLIQKKVGNLIYKY